MAFNFKFFLVRDDKEIPVNPARHIFREGDRFKVQITTNTPGIIMVANRDPLGKETFLGSWPIERAFSKVMIPAEGYFEFYGPKGEDLLYVLFIPARLRKTPLVPTRIIVFQDQLELLLMKQRKKLE